LDFHPSSKKKCCAVLTSVQNARPMMFRLPVIADYYAHGFGFAKCLNIQ
jgi:hypothetical protein